ncbi:STAS domain-containing protein [Actinophytocola xanthii]|uniref:Anti-sigma factor antagonist n=1 Tax=Actinophytocola xanthii TaxID=1912961 RepID=A0A1Q8C1I8_9PSEU|nr:STAS domain-containing protein [Actinophytocola xanthii]OLF08231.1 anti-anti-sigma factor [Actinophytocola xanthii]
MADSDSVDLTPSVLETATGSVALEQQHGTVVLRVTGALDLALAPKLQQQFDRALRSEPELVVIDLTAVDFLASAGMAVLITAHRQLESPGRVHIVAAGRITLRPMEITRLTDELVVFPTLSAALGTE